jgi:threonine/homoserine/homoserine lactone efflux protein
MVGMSPLLLLGFVGAVFLLALVPGPAFAIVVRRSALHGTRAALPVVAGIEVGLYAWAAASAVGVAALVTASTVAHEVLRWGGALVLLVLGVQAWRAARTGGDGLPVAADPPSGRRAALAGMLTNLANPKAAVFAFAFYPQFVPAGAHALRATLLLGLVHIAVDGAWFLGVAALVGRARSLFLRPAVRARLERVTAVLLLALGARLALTS